MSARPSVIFVLNLLQDVSVVRGLAYLAAREFDADLIFLVSRTFMARDRKGPRATRHLWRREMEQLAADTGADIVPFAGPADLSAAYHGRRGVVFGASESDLSAHGETHTALALAPPRFLTVTLQHGLECVGFLHNTGHVQAHGENAVFAADVVCGWAEAATLTSLTASQRAKLLVTGPPMLLQRADPASGAVRDAGALVCENLHSVRLRLERDHAPSFLEAFEGFCAARSRKVTLRPHPAGRYTLKSGRRLPRRAQLETRPLYKVDLSRHTFGISAPSTILLDMMLADLPVAVWRDANGAMDVATYRGLPRVSTAEDWLRFERDAVQRRDMLVARQRAVMADLGLVTNGAEVYRRFARLIARGLALRDGEDLAPASPATGDCSRLRWAAGKSALPRATPKRDSGTAVTTVSPPRRILFVAPTMLPTLEIAFLEPLSALTQAGDIAHTLLVEADFVAMADGVSDEDARARVATAVHGADPDLVVFCRYNGPLADAVLAAARQHGAAVLYHLDDDILNIPRTLGAKKHTRYHEPERLAAVRALLSAADLVYCSTRPLARRIASLGLARAVASGPLAAASDILTPAAPRPITTIGYMGGSDHAHDFALAVSGLTAFLARHKTVRFELFSSMPLPKPLKAVGARVQHLPAVHGYRDFRQAFAARSWDIGLCPLHDSDFNRLKSDVKWLEYTSTGTAVIASAGIVYDDCCADGRGILVRGEAGWLEALERLTLDPEARAVMVRRAQRHLLAHHRPDQLKDQILEVFQETAARARSARCLN